MHSPPHAHKRARRPNFIITVKSSPSRLFPSYVEIATSSETNTLFQDVSSETNNVGRQSQTKRTMFQGCLKRNQQVFEDVSSETEHLSMMSQAKQAYTRGR
eukprot:607434-Pyramimonas_sp.AAC.1